MIEFPLTVLYTQTQAYRAGMPRAGSLWTDDHVAQGFARRLISPSCDAVMN